MDQVGQTRPGRIGDSAMPGAGLGPAGGAGTDPAAFIDQTVRSNRAACFSKLICPSSRKAKEILSSHLPADSCAVIELDQRPDGEALHEELKRKTGKSTVPVVFLNGDFVGGADELGEMESSGQLDRRLQGAA